MRSHAAIAATLVLSGCALGLRVPPNVDPAPPEYHRDVAALIKFVSPDQVKILCAPEGAPPSDALMCVINGAWIIAPWPWLYPDDPYAVALGHEGAHVLGQPPDHSRPDAKK